MIDTLKAAGVSNLRELANLAELMKVWPSDILNAAYSRRGR